MPSRLIASLAFCGVPAVIGLAALAWGYPWLAALFFVAAGSGVAAELVIARKARRGGATQREPEESRNRPGH